MPGHPYEDEVVFRVEARGKGIHDVRDLLVYCTTDLSFPCHTDGSGKPAPYDVVLLHCVRQDESGGDSIVSKLADVVSHLKPKKLETLQRAAYPFPFGKAPIISEKSGNVWIRYNRDELDYYTSKHQVVFTEDQRQALASLSGVLNLLQTRFRRFRLRPADCLIINNKTALHGRYALCPNSKRLIKRIHLYW